MPTRNDPSARLLEAYVSFYSVGLGWTERERERERERWWRELALMMTFRIHWQRGGTQYTSRQYLLAALVTFPLE